MNQLIKLIKKIKKQKKMKWISLKHLKKWYIFFLLYEQNKTLCLLRTQEAPTLPLESDKHKNDRVPWVLMLLCLLCSSFDYYKDEFDPEYEP